MRTDIFYALRMPIAFGISLALMSWGALLEFGSGSAIAAVAQKIDHDFGWEWPYVMMAVGAFLAAGTLRHPKCTWLYRTALVLSMMVWAAMSVAMLDRGWYWAFSTVMPPSMAAMSLILKVVEMRRDEPLWRNSSLS